MSEMVDRVAASILMAEARERGVERVTGWDDLPEELKSSLRLQAAAGIEAMRELTQGMTAAANPDGSWPLEVEIGFYRAYSRMIDAALGPPPQTRYVPDYGTITRPADDDRLETVHISVATHRLLLAGGFRTAGDVKGAADWELLRIPGIGRKRLAGIREVIW